MRKSLVVAVTLMLSIFAGTAGAHVGAGMTGGFISGFSHPILGWDHVIDMVAASFGARFWVAWRSGFLLLSSRWLWHLVARLVSWGSGSCCRKRYCGAFCRAGCYVGFCGSAADLGGSAYRRCIRYFSRACARHGVAKPQARLPIALDLSWPRAYCTCRVSPVG